MMHPKFMLGIFNNPDIGSFKHRPAVIVLDSSSTSLPSTVTLVLDGVTLSIGDRVLFTNLSDSAKNNRIYRIDKSRDSSIFQFELEIDGRSVIGDPVAMDGVSVKQGSYEGTFWGFDGVSWINLDLDYTESNDLKVDGSNSPTANISWASHKITSAANGTDPGDVVNKSQLDTVATNSLHLNGDNRMVNSIAWSADGGGNIGSVDGGITKLRPGKMWVKTGVYVGDTTEITDQQIWVGKETGESGTLKLGAGGHSIYGSAGAYFDFTTPLGFRFFAGTPYGVFIGPDRFLITGDILQSGDGAWNLGYFTAGATRYRPGKIYVKNEVRIGDAAGETGTLNLGAQSSSIIANATGNITVTAGGTPFGTIFEFLQAPYMVPLLTLHNRFASFFRPVMAPKMVSTIDDTGYFGMADIAVTGGPLENYRFRDGYLSRSLRIADKSTDTWNGEFYLGKGGAKIVGGQTTTDLTFNGKLKAITDPSDPQDAATRNYVDTGLLGKEPANANIQTHIGSTSNPHSVTKTQVGLGNVENLKVNLIAIIAPAVTDDSSAGYAIGSRWVDTIADKEYVCLDSSVGAAVWTETTQSGGGGSDPFSLHLNGDNAMTDDITWSIDGSGDIGSADGGTTMLRPDTIWVKSHLNLGTGSPAVQGTLSLGPGAAYVRSTVSAPWGLELWGYSTINMVAASGGFAFSGAPGTFFWMGPGQDVYMNADLFTNADDIFSFGQDSTGPVWSRWKYGYLSRSLNIATKSTDTWNGELYLGKGGANLAGATVGDLSLSAASGQFVKLSGKITTDQSVVTAVPGIPGVVTKKLEIFDASGTSLGFIPIYDAIT